MLEPLSENQHELHNRLSDCIAHNRADKSCDGPASQINWWWFLVFVFHVLLRFTSFSLQYIFAKMSLESLPLMKLSEWAHRDWVWFCLIFVLSFPVLLRAPFRQRRRACHLGWQLKNVPYEYVKWIGRSGEWKDIWNSTGKLWWLSLDILKRCSMSPSIPVDSPDLVTLALLLFYTVFPKSVVNRHIFWVDVRTS